MNNFNCYPITLSEFKAKLKSKDKGEVVGQACRASSCPLAIILRDTLQGEVTVFRNNTFCNNHKFDNPDWVIKFAEEIDFPRSIGVNVTVEEALKVVNSIEE